MGLPMVQVFMIMARQLSKPVSDFVMRQGKAHPGFRDKMLVPVGRGIVNLTTRLRMRNLGLGAPTNLGPISESTALEQASEFVQQIVIFGYSVGVFAAYHYYSKMNEKEVVLADDFRKLLVELDTRFAFVEKRLDDVDMQLRNMNKSVVDKIFRSKSDPVLNKTTENASSRPISTSIPFDEALQKVMPSNRADELKSRNVKVTTASVEDKSSLASDM
ncbi:putative OPA3-like protein [Aphelenchoides besseyi]|nr:putative OPA3-like protein [Aphelenchoides besseyi]KAI6236776.1 putative OPA3-like protein [Aphelenchoides besseyi]